MIPNLLSKIKYSLRSIGCSACCIYFSSKWRILNKNEKRAFIFNASQAWDSQRESLPTRVFYISISLITSFISFIFIASTLFENNLLFPLVIIPTYILAYIIYQLLVGLSLSFVLKKTSK